MIAIQGTVKNGQVVLDYPIRWNEGSRVEVSLIAEHQPAIGMHEEDWPTTSEGIAELLARMDNAEPGWLSPEDDAAWRSARHAQNNQEKARFSADAENLQRMWK